MLDQTLSDVMRRNIRMSRICFQIVSRKEVEMQDTSSIRMHYPHLRAASNKTLCGDLLTSEPGMCRPHPITTQSFVYIWNKSVMYAGGSATYRTYAFL